MEEGSAESIDYRRGSCFVPCAPPTHRRYRDIDSDRVITSGTEHGGRLHGYIIYGDVKGAATREPVKLRERIITAVLSTQSINKTLLVHLDHFDALVITKIKYI